MLALIPPSCVLEPTIYRPIVDNLGDEIQKNHLLFHSGNNHQRFVGEEIPIPEQVEDTCAS